jgi:hypothetical protein
MIISDTTFEGLVRICNVRDGEITERMIYCCNDDPGRLSSLRLLPVTERQCPDGWSDRYERQFDENVAARYLAHDFVPECGTRAFLTYFANHPTGRVPLFHNTVQSDRNVFAHDCFIDYTNVELRISDLDEVIYVSGLRYPTHSIKLVESADDPFVLK